MIKLLQASISLKAAPDMLDIHQLSINTKETSLYNNIALSNKGHPQSNCLPSHYLLYWKPKDIFFSTELSTMAIM